MDLHLQYLHNMKTLAYKNNIGGVAIAIIAEGVSIEDYCKTHLDVDIEYLEITEDVILPDSMFSDAWIIKNDTIAIDIIKAKEVWLEKFRKARTPLLAALDVEFMRAIESGNTALQSEIAGKKQALRDVTSIGLPDTLEEIKATWPDILGHNPFLI